MSFWRKFAKVVLVLDIIACLVLVVFIGIGQRYIGIMERTLILVGGIILVLVAHTVFGMFIELCDNVAEIKGKKEVEPTSHVNVSSFMNGGRK